MEQTNVTLESVNNAFYDTLGIRWYTASDDPIALLRAESRLRNPWILSELEKHNLNRPCKVLDMGCGAGFLSNALAHKGHDVTGIDLSRESLAVASAYDSTNTAKYRQMNVTQLEFQDSTFDAVCAMDLLEHVENPQSLISEASRVLKPNGLLFFHTFNRNPISRLVVIKGVEWFVKNTPKNMHIYRLFLKPKEIQTFCNRSDLQVREFRGVRPDFNRAFFKMLLTQEVSEDFRFKFTPSLLMGFSGVAQKKSFS